MTTKLGDCLNSVRRLANENHVRFCLDNRGQTLAKDRMIFNTQDAYLFGLVHRGSPRCGQSLTHMCTRSQHPRETIIPAHSPDKPETDRSASVRACAPVGCSWEA